MTQTIDQNSPPQNWQPPTPPPPQTSRPWYRKPWVWVVAAIIFIAIAASAGSGSPKTARLPAGSDQPAPTTASTAAPAAVVVPATAAPTTATTAVVAAVSACDRVREALLTGTQAQINTAMTALQADKTADATAREYADYYLHRDATDKQMREMDVGLIRMSC